MATLLEGPGGNDGFEIQTVWNDPREPYIAMSHIALKSSSPKLLRLFCCDTGVAYSLYCRVVHSTE